MAQDRDNQGQFKKGSDAARQAGRKGGESSQSGGSSQSSQNRSSNQQKSNRNS